MFVGSGVFIKVFSTGCSFKQSGLCTVSTIVNYRIRQMNGGYQIRTDDVGTKIPCLTAWRNPIEASLQKANCCYCKWNMVDSNYRHAVYKTAALTNWAKGPYWEKWTCTTHTVATLYTLLNPVQKCCYHTLLSGLGFFLRAKVLLLTWSVTHRPMLLYIIPANSPCQSRTGVFAVKGQWLSRLPNGPYEDTP